MIELIAECSSNHGGDRGLMEAFIAQYAEAGANFVKFQSYQVQTLRPGDPQRDWLAHAELSDEDHHFLIETCARYKTKFLTTCFHASRVPFLASLGLEAIKIGSAEVSEWSLLSAVYGENFPRVFASLGVQRRELVNDELGTFWEWFRCVSRYPAEDWMCRQESYSPVAGRIREVGWSDHCIGIRVCKEAIVQGASVIEKHVSLPEQPRPMRPFEATVEQFKELRAFADEDPARFIGRWQHGA